MPHNTKKNSANLQARIYFFQLIRKSLGQLNKGYQINVKDCCYYLCKYHIYKKRYITKITTHKNSSCSVYPCLVPGSKHFLLKGITDFLDIRNLCWETV